VRPETTLKADRFAPINVYQLHTRLILSHEGHRDTVEIEPVAETDLLNYLLSRQADRVETAVETVDLIEAVRAVLDTLERLRAAVAKVQRKRQAVHVEEKIAVAEDDGEID